jgi:hypothetical protein
MAGMIVSAIASTSDKDQKIISFASGNIQSRKTDRQDNEEESGRALAESMGLGYLYK